MSKTFENLPVLVAGGGIGGLAAALALTRQGLRMKGLEQVMAADVAPGSRLAFGYSSMQPTALRRPIGPDA